MDGESMDRESLSGHGPLAGIRVLDFGQYLAGPLVAMMLADQGADVVRVDPLEGPSWQHPANAVLNRGKRSIALDLKNSADRTTARRLVSSADVLVENFRPGVMDRLGLGAREMTSLNPGLVYLSLPGFSSSDTTSADLQAWEGVVAASAGVFSDMSFNRQLYGKVPSYQGLALPSADAAVLGAIGVVTALLARQETGRGEIIEVPLLGALLECTAFNTMKIHDLPQRYLSGREMELARRRAEGEPCALTYEQVDELHDPFYARYDCKDGRPFYVCCVGHRGHIDRLLKGLGVWEQLLAEGLPVNDPFTSTRDWDPSDEGNSVYADPLTGRWASRIRAVLRGRFRERTSSEWEDFFAHQRIPGVADKSTAEWLVSEHARAAGLIIDVDDPEHGPMLQPGVAAWVDGHADSYCEPHPAQRLDADRDRVLQELDGNLHDLGGSSSANLAAALREVPPARRAPST